MESRSYSVVCDYSCRETRSYNREILNAVPVRDCPSTETVRALTAYKQTEAANGEPDFHGIDLSI